MFLAGTLLNVATVLIGATSLPVANFLPAWLLASVFVRAPDLVRGAVA